MIDSDVLQIKVFSRLGDDEKKIMALVEKDVNAYLSNYSADLVHSICPQVTEIVFTDGSGTMTRYTVTVALRS